MATMALLAVRWAPAASWSTSEAEAPSFPLLSGSTGAGRNLPSRRFPQPLQAFCIQPHPHRSGDEGDAAGDQTAAALPCTARRKAPRPADLRRRRHCARLPRAHQRKIPHPGKQRLLHLRTAVRLAR